MAASPLLESVERCFWPSGESSRSIWAILDGARDRRIFSSLLNSHQEYSCLYSGEIAPEIEVVAPHLVQLDFGDRFTRKLLEDGWGHSWGVFLKCDSGIARLRKHLRGFLLVRDERARRLLFRYYDPRVLRVYLPTCSAEELKAVFGPIQSFWMETGGAEEMVQFSVEREKLVQQAIKLNQP